MPVQAIDMHVHLSTREWVEDAMGPYQASIARYFGRTIAVSSLDAMADLYRGAGIHAVILGWDAQTATGRPAVPNDLVAEAVRRHPDVFTGFGSVDPHRADAVARIRDVHALGLRGLKIHPTLQAFDPSDPRYEAYFAEAARLGLPILSHAGTSGVGAREPGGQGLRLDYAAPIKLDPVAARYPGLRILLAHVGWPWHLEAIAMALHKTNVFIDISGWKYQYLPPEVLREMRTRLRGQICFGTDYPMFDPVSQLQSFRDLAGELKLSPEIQRAVLYDNACRYLGFDPADRASSP
jgi:predicted TIM-barrel fold metal-dependent hydrolase